MVTLSFFLCVCLCLCVCVCVMKMMKMIASLSDFENFLSDFSMLDYVQKLFEQRPDTKWIFYQILSLNVFMYKIYDGKSLLKI